MEIEIKRVKRCNKKLKLFTNHQKKKSNCLMIVLKFHLWLCIDQFMEKDSKY